MSEVKVPFLIFKFYSNSISFKHFAVIFLLKSQRNSMMTIIFNFITLQGMQGNVEILCIAAVL